jgi:hypothetical protein
MTKPKPILIRQRNWDIREHSSVLLKLDSLFRKMAGNRKEIKSGLSISAGGHIWQVW